PPVRLGRNAVALRVRGVRRGRRARVGGPGRDRIARARGPATAVAPVAGGRRAPRAHLVAVLVHALCARPAVAVAVGRALAVHTVGVAALRLPLAPRGRVRGALPAGGASVRLRRGTGARGPARTRARLS